MNEYSSLLGIITGHVEKQTCLERGSFIHKRGWFNLNGKWKSPHDGSLHEDSIIPMIQEIMNEVQKAKCH